MTVPDRQAPLPPEVERRLDSLLLEWRACYGLADARAEAVRSRVLRRARLAEPGLSYVWWDHLFGGLTDLLQHATEVPASARRAWTSTCGNPLTRSQLRTA